MAIMVKNKRKFYYLKLDKISYYPDSKILRKLLQNKLKELGMSEEIIKICLD